MSAFHVVFAVIALITIMSTALGSFISMYGDPKRSAAQKTAVANLFEISKLGTAAIIGLLGGISIPT